ncbi:hypothetical protein CPC735_006720 [Coccidioides posadasii C735 delta SOWgp]|uniref:Uncharacterized protein n=2 Tax=Coccidioides posadasii TaxID=199306 RepID=A0A0J6FUT1_COCPO|nr:hypothetical protein CPC735_006720 [Coccidioides posadasii C735 delta SOWgp]EER26500.1 hypothetical protein CPC735_006720 [Coccidioides posadasii C735 delta SOWgp]KMM72914.1 hypothetical protein CPAG_09204 [Coccidioides posadasii RMSCC 3488]|eukprot:XP_003068645.1 hypothetical protein CPC735_006720 [Coccidioides posadasii C735 delta SOWgp]
MECEYVSEDESMEYAVLWPTYYLLGAGAYRGLSLLRFQWQNTSSKRDATLHIFSLCLLSSLIMQFQSLIAVSLSLGFTLFAVSLPLSPKPSIHSPTERRPITYSVVQVDGGSTTTDSGSPNVITVPIPAPPVTETLISTVTIYPSSSSGVTMTRSSSLSTATKTTSKAEPTTSKSPKITETASSSTPNSTSSPKSNVPPSNAYTSSFDMNMLPATNMDVC